MHICFLTSDCVIPTKGGVENVVYNLSRLFVECGYQVSVISGKPYPANYSESKISYYVLPNLSELSASENMSFVTLLQERRKIDVLVNASHEESLFELCAFMKSKLNLPLITTLYCTPDAVIKAVEDDLAAVWIKEKTSLYKFVKLFFLYVGAFYRRWIRKSHIRRKYALQYEIADAFLLESSLYKKIFLSLIKTNDDSKLYAIRNPLTKFEIKTTKSRKKQILFVARMVIEQKRPDRLLKIWRRLQDDFPDWKILLIGDGADKEAIVSYSERLGCKNVQFIGFSNLEEYYQTSEILCLTSTFEGYGLVLEEAQSNGVIPIAFDSYAAVRDIITPQVNGVLVPPFKLKVFESELRSLMSSEACRDTYRKSIQKSLESRDVDMCLLQWNKLFSLLVKQKS